MKTGHYFMDNYTSLMFVNNVPGLLLAPSFPRLHRIQKVLAESCSSYMGVKDFTF